MSAEQLALDLAEITVPEYEPDATIQERWEQWRDQNPWVLPYIAGLLDDWSAHGGRRVGVKAAVEWARYNYTRQTRGSVWKFDNSHSSRLARDLIAAYPHLAGVIETRGLRAA